MRRARLALSCFALVLAFCVPVAARAAQGVTRMNAIGLLDYSHKPTFKVGDYVRYQVSNLDVNGDVTDRYTMTIMIAGQEEWWGERCFYLETWVEGGAKSSNGASLMSYDIYNDSLPEEHLQSYMRKTVLGFDADQGGLVEVLVAPKPAALTSRSTLSRPYTLQRDTVGADTVSTPIGVLHATKTTQQQRWGNTGGSGDSTVYKELTEDRTQWYADEIPLTRLAHEITWSTETRRAWLIGRSQDGRPTQVVGKGGVDARVVAYGHGLVSKMLPADRVHSFDDPPAGATRKPGAAATPKKPVARAKKR